MTIITKPWGQEKILEKNKRYAGKLIIIDNGKSTSRQYHKVKHETLFLLQGKAIIEFGKPTELSYRAYKIDDKDNYEDRLFIIPPRTTHRLTGLIDCIFMEFSTPELSDIVRIEDDYGRISE